MNNEFVRNLRNSIKVGKPNFESLPGVSSWKAGKIANSLRSGERANIGDDKEYIYGARWMGESMGDYNSPDYFSQTGKVSKDFPGKKATIYNVSRNEPALDLAIRYDDKGAIAEVDVTKASNRLLENGVENRTYRGGDISNLFRRLDLDIEQYEARDTTDPANRNKRSIYFGSDSHLYSPANVFGSNGALYGTQEMDADEKAELDYRPNGQYRDQLRRYNDAFSRAWRELKRQ